MFQLGQQLACFILPAGTPLAAAFHVARTVCRRSERRVVTLSTEPGATIPAKHTCDGADVSPPLAWTGDAWAVVWNDADDVDVGTYFTSFTVCPP